MEWKIRQTMSLDKSYNSMLVINGQESNFLKTKRIEALQDISVSAGWWWGEIWDLEIKVCNPSCNKEYE